MLFNLYVNDLHRSLEHESLDQVTLNNNKISSLFYADDLALISKTCTGLQNSLDILKQYCYKWKLHVNLSKTKIIIFTIL